MAKLSRDKFTAIMFPQLIRDGYTLKFFRGSRYRAFLETNLYFDFVYELCNKDGAWYLFASFENFETFVVGGLRNLINTEPHHQHVVFHNQSLVWPDVANSDDMKCSKCGSKKIEYVGLGIGSSAPELICPKC